MSLMELRERETPNQTRHSLRLLVPNRGPTMMKKIQGNLTPTMISIVVVYFTYFEDLTGYRNTH